MRNGNGKLESANGLRVDLERKLLLSSDDPVNLPGKAIEVLCTLVERKGEVVTKDELLDRVWPDAFVEESVLSQNIYLLRKLFKESGFSGDLIQTVPRRGYRFAGDIPSTRGEILIEHEVEESAIVADIAEASVDPSPARRSSIGLVVRPVAALAVVAIVAFAAWYYFQPSPREVSSIAVLPLRNLTSEASENSLALGLTDSLISRLGKLNRFAVRPFSAVEKFAASGKDAIAFGQELKTDAVLEGTIQSAGDRMRVNLRLIDVRDGSQMWAESFDENEADILKLQDSISARVARFLLIRLTPDEERLLAKSPTANPEAYRLYIAGRDRWMRRDATVDSLAFYRKAIELDPNFALPHLGIADQYAFTYETGTAEQALARAVELDPDLAEAHATRGFLQMFHHWDWKNAESSFMRAIELAPNSSKAHHWYGVYLSVRGRLDEAEQEMRKALELDPSALVIMTDLAEVHYFQHEYESAQDQLNHVLSIDPSFLNARLVQIKVRHKLGASFFIESATFDAYRQWQLKADGLRQEFEPGRLERLIELKDESALRNTYMVWAESDKSPGGLLSLSKIYSVVGENEKSLDALERASAGRPFVLPFVAVDPLWDPIREDPRFKAILRRMNL